MKYVSTKDTAEKWKLSRRRVLKLCSEGRIENIDRVGNTWIIPEDMMKPIDGRSLRYIGVAPRPVKPFVKWAGGKGQLLDKMQQIYPKDLGKSITKYAEPFVGGGAVLFNILSTYRLREVYISDVNAELINTYKIIRDEVSGLIALLEKYQNEYVPMGTEDRKGYYYEKRETYNELETGKNTLEKAALFIFLNKTCFNGLYRVNRKGFFNVPMGAYKNPLICDKKNLINISKMLGAVTITSGDYREADTFIDKHTLAYFDPPYRPITETANFTAYTENLFDDLAQKELAEFVDKLNVRGAKIIVSNSDPKNSRTDDEFFDNLYAEYEIRRVEASRMINCNSESRGKISELLICNY